MTHLQTHNTRELPLVEEIKRNELHLLNEFVQDLDEQDPDVVWAIEERTADIISQGTGAHMASLVDA